jgi:hypothetical protein
MVSAVTKDSAKPIERVVDLNMLYPSLIPMLNADLTARAALLTN